MQTYWKDNKGDDEDFWSHEWDKHGTCISTLEPTCYSDFQPNQEVVDYFKKTVELFKSLPSYDWLAEAGINPSDTETYSSADIQAALKAKHGNEVTIGCKDGQFNEIWYHYNVKGSVVTGEFVSAPPDGTKSTCPDDGIQYLPKNGGSGGNRTATASTEAAKRTSKRIVF
jgi:ribonuclease T2